MGDADRRDDVDVDEGDVAAGPESGVADEATKADLGLIGGTGASSGEGTVAPYGTEEEDEEG